MIADLLRAFVEAVVARELTPRLAALVPRARSGGLGSAQRTEGARVTRIDPTRAVERCERLAKLGPAPAWWRVFALRRWLSAYRAIMALDISVSAEMLRGIYTDEKLREMATAPNPFITISKVPAVKQGTVGRWVEPRFSSMALDGEFCLCGAGAHVIRPMHHETCPIYKPAGAV